MKWRPSDPVHQEAVWFARRRDSVQARQTEDGFETWLASDPENALRYGQCELMWERVGELAQDDDVREWLRQADERAARAHVHASQAASEQRRRVTHWAGWAAAAAVALTVVGAMSYQRLRAPVYQTAVGEQRDVRLPDGSRMTLNTATRVVVHYSAHARRIELTAGEAVFDVRKAPARSFEVAAGAGVARAIGTRFAVTRATNEVTVSVLEGIVEVVRREPAAAGSTPNDDGANRLVPVLESGQAASVTNEGTVSRLVGADLRRIQAWQDRKLDFEAEPLDKAIAEVNRYATRRLTLGSAELAQVRVSGIFRIAELEGFTFALQESFGLRVVEKPDELLVLPGEPKSLAGEPKQHTQR